MTSREEREEVAKKLREGGIARNETEAYVLLLHCIGIRPQLPAVNTYKPALERLADLIDPTCELKIQDGHACCGNCGHRLAGEYEEEEGYWCFRPYCPYCGARVVSGDAKEHC